ncbi:MAG: NAD(P)H-binding protein [Parvularculales bacterium]
MKEIIIFGATGKTGYLAVRHAVQKEYKVTAFGRSVNKIDFDQSVIKIQGDALSEEDVAKALSSQDCAIVCLGPANLKDQLTLTKGAENIVRAMKQHNVKRVIFISAAGVGESWKQIAWYSKLFFKTMLKTIISEHAKEEYIFKESGLDWTAVRAAVLTNKTSENSITASNTSMVKTITREGLARFLIDQIGSTEFINQAITVRQK